MPYEQPRRPAPHHLLQTTAAGESAQIRRPPVIALPEPGDYLGPYRVVGVLGAGSMGIVYRAIDRERHQPVAVKLLHRWRADAGAPQERWLSNEAGALARLCHPNIVAVLGVGTFDDRPFLAMELVEGLTMTDWLDDKRPSWSAIVRVAAAAAEGLAAVHEAGLVHGDFKPDNVMVGDDGRVRVMDFGLARSAMQAEPGMGSLLVDRDGISRHCPVGTPAYMAPEQLAGRRISPRSDQFAFCVTLYEALYGQRPFPGHTPAELAYHVMRGQRRPAPAHADVPAWLRAVVNRGLNLVGASRWPSMSALSAALTSNH